MTTYSHIIEWDGQTVKSEGCLSKRRAFLSALGFALISGYKPPRWYQFWRWSERRFTKEEIAEAKAFIGEN